MATIDTIAGVLESNLDIDPATVTPEATFESLGHRLAGHGRAHLRLGGGLRGRLRRARGTCHRGRPGRLHRLAVSARRVSAELGPRSHQVAGPFCCLVPCVCAERGPMWARAALPEETCLSPVR